jgi:sugar phosphate isomerase/epimerase
MHRRHLLRSLSLLAAGAASPAAAHVNPKERKVTPGAPFKLAVAAYSYRDYLKNPAANYSLFDFIQTCADLGTDGVELTEYYFEKPITHDYLLRLKRECHLKGQTITGTPIGGSFTMPAGPERDLAIETFKQWVDVSAVLGSPAIRAFAGSAPKGLTETEARKNAIESFKVLSDYAGQKGVFVAVENHGGVTAEPDGLLEIIQAIESPWIGINLDSGNFHTDDPYGDLAKCAPYAVVMQYKVEMTPRGKPTEPADLPRILKILQQVGYRGFVTLEYEAKEDPKTAVPRHVAEMRKAISSLTG